MNTFSKKITLTDLEGSLIDYSSFGLTDINAVLQYLQITKISSGNLSISMGDEDDYLAIGAYPFIISGIRFEEFWLLPSQAGAIVSLIVAFIPASSAIS